MKTTPKPETKIPDDVYPIKEDYWLRTSDKRIFEKWKERQARHFAKLMRQKS